MRLYDQGLTASEVSDLFNAGSYVLMALDVFIIILAIFVILESASAFTREKKIAEAGVSREETPV